ncbi:glycosyltransferase family 2 protein [Aequorivita lipolytica]|uniref:glycosyltransferase family 2 protein n=1 Tax=Aequorivita lipolytica TaxID=153267 RepID=UPI000DBC0B6F|nr:glycosyltransferase [Aequorivita lipolytica]SRX52039.1 Putative glycosyltransferase EpsE [Aequorivita lipolytica]
MVKVSVIVPTYNQEEYIAECIQGICKQQIDFPIEVIIGDDCSIDNNQAIILKEIEKNKNPLIGFSLNFHKSNLSAPPNIPGKLNFLSCLKMAQGKYIALCEGDDYWTDPLKLQKQVDFMEKNPDYSGIGSNSETTYPNKAHNHLFGESKESILNLNDLLQARKFHTATFLFRATAFKIDFPLDILSGDRVLFMLIACSGKIKLLKDVTAVYRKNEGGISRTVTADQLKKDFKIAKYISKYNSNFDYYKLQSFVAYTVFQYAKKISLLDYVVNSYFLLYYRLMNRGKKSRKAIITDSIKLIMNFSNKLVLFN